MAEENTCFFDICLPNYTTDSLRRITYFKEIHDINSFERSDIIDDTFSRSKPIDNLRILQYDTTPPNLPVNFEIAELPYYGEMK